MEAEQNVTKNDMDEEFNEFSKKINCFVVVKLPYHERCDFFHNSTCLAKESNIWPYMHFIACHFQCRNQFEELVIMALLALVMFGLLVCVNHVVDKYYTPGLQRCAKLMHLSEHLAGVTILSIGNALPEMLSGLVEDSTEQPVLANYYSRALFISLCSSGIISLISPFRMNIQGTTRDTLFFMFGVLSVDYLLQTDGDLEVVECYSIWNKLELLSDKGATRESEKLRKIYENLALDAEMGSSNRNRQLGRHQSSLLTHRQHVPSIVRRQVCCDMRHGGNRNLFKDFFASLTPIKGAEWRDAQMVTRFYYIARAPVVVLTALFIPLVDYDIDRRGWSKLLNCLQIIITPAVTVIILKSMLYNPDYTEFWYFNVMTDYIYGVYTMVFTTPLALLVFINSRTDTAPCFHYLFSIMNLTASVITIFVCSEEINHILHVIGATMKVPLDYMQVTISAIASGLGDVVANSAQANAGYERMAYAACIGGPFITVVLGTSCICINSSVRGIHLNRNALIGEYGLSSFFFLCMGLFTTLLWSSTLNWHTRRSIGVFSLLVYALFLITTFLIKRGIMHSFTPDSKVTDTYMD
ncbi:putative sodium/calcium exchanger 7 isoform X2 [Drosophila busckii]|uniref:putative sodium/calcium exchanger 7 isoform X2 n=1 Tax=Drosophila busckii TaxID=30019 RepID=UPI00083EC6F4|nr:putative sodium/calcium exchanger 7 isoform X2 [Drosophila busckii]